MTESIISFALEANFDRTKALLDYLLQSDIFSEESAADITKNYNILYEVIHNKNFDSAILQQAMTTAPDIIMLKLQLYDDGSFLKPALAILKSNIDLIFNLYASKFTPAELEVPLSFIYSFQSAIDYFSANKFKPYFHVASDLDYSAKYFSQLIRHKIDTTNRNGNEEFIQFLDEMISKLQNLQDNLALLTDLQKLVFSIRFIQYALIGLLPQFAEDRLQAYRTESASLKE